MQYDVNNGLLQVVIEGEEIKAVVGEAAQIDVGEAINYIQTGTAEIEEAVEEGISDFNENATEKTNDFNLNAQNKTNDFNTNAQEKTTAFNNNAASKKLDFNTNASEKTNDFNLNAQEKTSDYNTNASEKLSEYNSNASEKLSEYNLNANQKTADFNTNAENKTTLFNNNYTEKKAIIDAKAAEASLSAAEAKQWAIGDPSEPIGNSAKYWAEYAQQETAGVEERVTVIEGKIPSTATSSNKLTDKSYVDSQDNNLQTQIDTIVASSDVFDIVGTYAELQAYDISTVPVNDIVKVLADSTHNNAATYYRCVESGGVKSWSYVGAEGAYYTKGEADNKFSTITATGNYLDYTGNTLSLENSSGTVLSSVTIKSTPDLDNTTISLNSSSELQAIGTVNKNTTTGATNPVYDWVGTLQEYIDQNVAVAHPTWICYITDDVQGGITVYTKNQVNNLLSVKANSADVYTKTETDTALALKANTANFQVVSALPAEPTAGVFYFVLES